MTKMLWKSLVPLLNLNKRDNTHIVFRLRHLWADSLYTYLDDRKDRWFFRRLHKLYNKYEDSIEDMIEKIGQYACSRFDLHMPTPDHCGMHKHDFCHFCGLPMPYERITEDMFAKDEKWVYLKARALDKYRR